MLKMTYPKWLNFILFQSIWFIAVLGQGSLEWLLVLLLAAHFLLADDLRRELRIVLLCATIGVLADIILTLAGVFQFDPAPSILPIPLWLIAIWIGFVGTFRHSMSYMMDKPWIAIPAAALAAPLSYVAGMSLGAVSFGLDVKTTAIIVGLLWACLMALFIFIHRADRSSPSSLALI